MSLRSILLDRRITNVLNWSIDNLLPPIIRDNRLFMYLPFKVVFGKSADHVMSFKNKSHLFDQKQLEQYYYDQKVYIKRTTDLNYQCAELIFESIDFSSINNILDVGCGTGYLCNKLNSKCNQSSGNTMIYGVDMNISKVMNGENINYQKVNAEKLPFEDNFFDVVISTHTLEHVIAPQLMIAEMRRVCKKQLILVVPQQREYKYTPDLHMHFFPYPESLLRLMKNTKGMCKSVGNELFYIEYLD